MVDISIRGELWDDDSADVLRWWGFRDITAPMDIRAALEAAGGDEVTVLVNSPGGDMTVGAEIRSILRRYQGKTTALFQGYGASAATLAVSACSVIQSEPGALLCYHNPSGTTDGDYHEMRRSAEALRNARDCILEMYTARSGSRSREELISLMDKNIWITLPLLSGFTQKICPFWKSSVSPCVTYKSNQNEQNKTFFLNKPQFRESLPAG